MRRVFPPAVLGLWLAAAPARPVPLYYPPTGFSADMAFPGDSVCYFYPPTLHNPVDCRGEQIPAPHLEDPGVTLLGMGTIFEKQASYFFTITDVLLPDAEPINARTGAERMKGSVAELSRRAAGAAVRPVEAGLVQLSCGPAYRFLGNIPMSGSRHVGVLEYCFCGTDNLYTVTLMESGSDEKGLRAMGERFMEQVKVPPPQGMTALERGFRSVLILTGLSITVLLAGLTLYRARRQNKGRPSRARIK